jgi:hypothetical protein
MVTQVRSPKGSCNLRCPAANSMFAMNSFNRPYDLRVVKDHQWER